MLFPEMVYAATIVLVLIAGLAGGKRLPTLVPILAFSGYAMAGLAAFMAYQWAGNQQYTAFGGALDLGIATLFVRLLIAAAGAITVLLSRDSLRPLANAGTAHAEYYLLLLTVALGAEMLAGSRNLLWVWISLETTSIPAYLLAAWRRDLRTASESALKYVIFGAFSSATTVYGISWLYGLTGSLAFADVLPALGTTAGLIPALMLMAGLLFKAGAVPMHFWLPDMYQGIWYPAAGYLSVVPKAGVFYLLFAIAPAIEQSPFWLAMLVVAIATMSLGNLAALWQRNIRRLLAYSSIAHTGYLMIAVFVASRSGIAAASLYFVVYACMNLAAFALVGQFEQQGRHTFDAMRGFANIQPVTVVLFTALMAALIGLPPTGGFIAKWYLFASAVGKPGAVLLLVVAVVNTAMSAFYYLRAPALMVFAKADGEAPFQMPPLTLWVSMALTLAAVGLGVFGFDSLVAVFY